MPKKPATSSFSELRIHFTNHHSHTIHLDSNLQLQELINLAHREKVEELIEGLSYLLKSPYSLPDQALVAPISQLVAHPTILQTFSSRPFDSMEPLPFDPTRGFGGLFVTFEDNSSTSYITGHTPATISMVKTIYDTEEFLRLDQKWHLANYTTLLLCSRDDSESHRNVLIRGLKNSLNIIALLGVR